MNVEDYFKRIDQSKIVPFFLEKAKELVVNCHNKGADFYAISGFRDPEAQAALYAIGRTVDKDKKVVTNAPPWTSFHNYGFAIDFCRDADMSRDGLQPDWNTSDYKILQQEAHSLGLTSGLDFSSFPESPHVQLPFIAGGTGTLKATFLVQGMQGVWDFAQDNLSMNMMYKQFYKPRS